MGFADFTDNKGMVSQIKDMGNFTFMVDGALFNKRGATQIAIEDRKPAVLDFVSFGAGDNAAIIRFPYHISGRDINREGHVLTDTLQGVALVPYGD